MLRFVEKKKESAVREKQLADSHSWERCQGKKIQQNPPLKHSISAGAPQSQWRYTWRIECSQVSRTHPLRSPEAWGAVAEKRWCLMRVRLSYSRAFRSRSLEGFRCCHASKVETQPTKPSALDNKRHREQSSGAGPWWGGLAPALSFANPRGWCFGLCSSWGMDITFQESSGWSLSRAGTHPPRMLALPWQHR